MFKFMPAKVVVLPSGDCEVEFGQPVLWRMALSEIAKTDPAKAKEMNDVWENECLRMAGWYKTEDGRLAQVEKSETRSS